MLTTNRRYDIDWLRVIAIGLLLLYHVSIGFQPWGIMVGFITSDKTWPSLWIPMTALNIWRIPLLFFVSGMGVYFAMQQRTWKQLFLERAGRILVPFIFGIFLIFPISQYIWRAYNGWDQVYDPNPGHLWFLGNIFSYVILLSPIIFYLKANEEGRIAKAIKWIMSNPLGILVVMCASVAEAILVAPNPYELYSMTWHGFFIGLVAFFFGFCFVLSGSGFLKMILKWKWVLLLAAIALYTVRFVVFKLITAPAFLIAIESDCWILAVLGFGYRYLNFTNKALTYLSQAAYPVYIVHMIFQYAGSFLIFKLDIAAPLQFILLLVFTFGGSLALYEFVIRRINIIRPLFGLKMKKLEKTDEKLPAIG